jgi:hypothetical protein
MFLSENARLAFSTKPWVGNRRIRAKLLLLGSKTVLGTERCSKSSLVPGLNTILQDHHIWIDISTPVPPAADGLTKILRSFPCATTASGCRPTSISARAGIGHADRRGTFRKITGGDQPPGRRRWYGVRADAAPSSKGLRVDQRRDDARANADECTIPAGLKIARRFIKWRKSSPHLFHLPGGR